MFNKADKNKESVAKKNIALFREAMKKWSEGEPRAYLSSTKTGAGRKEILRSIGEMLQMG